MPTPILNNARDAVCRAGSPGGCFQLGCCCAQIQAYYAIFDNVLQKNLPALAYGLSGHVHTESHADKALPLLLCLLPFDPCLCAHAYRSQ